MLPSPNIKGSQAFLVDPRNADVLFFVNGEMVPRATASISVLDSGFVLGDGVWESFRLQNGRLVFVDGHLDRLFAGAATIDLEIGMKRDELIEALYRTVRENNMFSDVHIRLMVTRGLKYTPYQDPRYVVGKASVVIVAEHKQIDDLVRQQGLALFTSSVRCSPSDVFDMRLNSHSRLPLILALIQAIKAGADEALLLDPNGFVSTCNGTNFFIVKGREVWTSTGRFCFNGITRGCVISLEPHHGFHVLQKDFTLSEAYSADEAFITATYAGVTPVCKIDGRVIGKGMPGPTTARISEAYQTLVQQYCSAGAP